MRSQRAHLSGGSAWSTRLRSRAPGQPPQDPGVLAADRRSFQNLLVLLQRALDASAVDEAVELYQSALDYARSSAPSAPQRRWLATLEDDGRLARWTEAAHCPPVLPVEPPARPKALPTAAPEPLRQPSGIPATAATAPATAVVASPATDPAQITAAAVQARTALIAAATAGLEHPAAPSAGAGASPGTGPRPRTSRCQRSGDPR